MERINKSYSRSDSLGRRSVMELVICTYIPDSGKWCGYPKGQPHEQAYGESFDELQLKLHNLHRELIQAAPASPCYNNALLCWYWQRKILRRPY